ncbi:MAG: hypothetical protein IJ306_04190 [Oscillospiraceae bacterium]|nr:hypothetical protein [Oscillospiraceae bacterium]
MRIFAKFIGFEGSYLRFEGTATLEKIKNCVVIESVTEDSAVWELMCLGKADADRK